MGCSQTENRIYYDAGPQLKLANVIWLRQGTVEEGTLLVLV